MRECMHDLQKLQVINNQINFYPIVPTNPNWTLSALLAPVRPVYQTGQTGLACVRLETKNPEYPDVFSEYPDSQARNIWT